MTAPKPSKEATEASWIANFGNASFHGGPPGDNCAFCEVATTLAPHFDSFAAERVAEAVKAEREACAKEAEEHFRPTVAACIRARGAK